MFSGDDIDKPVKVLSGGERARVALARLLRQARQPAADGRADEPPRSRVERERSPQSLTHVRRHARVRQPQPQSLIRTLATRIWNVEDGRGRDLPGHARRVHVLDDAAPRSRSRPTTSAAARPAGRGASTGAKTRDDDKARKRREAEARQKRSAKLGPLEKQVAQLEERIGALEAEQKVRSAELADPTVYDDAARRNKLLSDYQAAAGQARGADRALGEPRWPSSRPRKAELSG